MGKNLQLKFFLHIFFDQILQFTYPYAFIMNVQATGEAFREHPELQNMNFLHFFSIFVGHFCPLGSTELIEFGTNSDPKHVIRMKKTDR
jgi:hypothetical protein